LVQGSNGNFYGMTSGGGTNGDGTVFRISSAGNLTTLYQFGGLPTDGRDPYGARLVQGSDGYFYGAAHNGGTNDVGTVFKITSQGTLTTLWQFGNDATNGQYPAGGLVQASDGYFYGTTYEGGTNGDGTVFRITTNGTLTTLWQFGGNPTNGQNPYAAGLVQGSDGNFYGTTIQGGTNNYGTVFRITTNGALTTLWQFSSGGTTNGTSPEAGLAQGSDGDFYGTTEYGGTNNVGTVFKLFVHLNPPANQISSILVDSTGTNLVFGIPSVASETYQLQFSPSMSPTNWVNVPAVSVTNSIGALLTVTNFGGASQTQGFYRFSITP
jgi:uncharacterized repeat protein (TIGR03803 family)